jgi:hypothetical protein
VEVEKGEIAAANAATMRNNFISESDRIVHGGCVGAEAVLSSPGADVDCGGSLELIALVDVSLSCHGTSSSLLQAPCGGVVEAVFSTASVAGSRRLRCVTACRGLSSIQETM